MQDGVGTEQQHEDGLGDEAQEGGLHAKPHGSGAVLEIGEAEELHVKNLVLVLVLDPFVVESVRPENVSSRNGDEHCQPDLLATNHARQMRHEATTEVHHTSGAANVDEQGKTRAGPGYPQLEVDAPMPKVPRWLEATLEQWNRRVGPARAGAEEGHSPCRQLPKGPWRREQTHQVKDL